MLGGLLFTKVDFVFVCKLFTKGFFFFFFQISGALLDEGQVRCIVDEIKRVLSVILRQKQDLAERTEVEEFDSEESDINEEIEEEEEDLFIEVCMT